MALKNDIFDREKRLSDGIKAPDGYFEDFADRMAAALPDRPELESPQAEVKRPKLWTRIRPYAYMAAMFAGVWLMLHIFTLMTNKGDGGLSLEKTPDLARAVENEQFVEDYVIDDINNWDLLDSMMADSISIYDLTDSIYNANPDPTALPDKVRDDTDQ